MASFEIASYKTRVEIERVGSPVVTHRNRVIELESVVGFHGIVERALLAFSTRWDSWSGTPAVGFLTISDPLNPRITGWLPANAYEAFYDVLRGEKPVFLFYTVAPIGGANYLSHLAVGTSAEPLGEGPADTSL